MSNFLTPKYLLDTISPSNDSCYSKIAQSISELTQFYRKTRTFNNTFFLFCIKEENKLDAKIKTLPTISRFKKLLLIYFKIDESPFFDIHNPLSVKLSNRYRLNFSHLNEYKFSHNFWDTVSQLCLCNAENKATSYYLETLWKPPFSWQYFIKSLWWWSCKNFVISMI